MTKRKTVDHSSWILFAFLLAALLLSADNNAWSETHALKAPDTYLSITLPAKADTHTSTDPLSQITVDINGWACGQHFLDHVVLKLRNINYHLKLLTTLNDSLLQIKESVDKGAFGKMDKSDIQRLVSTAMLDTLRQSSFSSERDLLERVEKLIDEETERKRQGLNSFFGSSENHNLFAHKIYGKPEGVWNLAKTEPDEPPSALFIAEKCFSKSDLEMMFNSVSQSTQNLQESLKAYRETKTRVLAAAQ
jgi:hypothetical protein